MKGIRQATLSLLLLFCLVLGSIPVSAADDELLGTVVDGSVLTDQTEDEYTVYPRARGSLISGGRGRIIAAGAGKVTLIGETYAHQIVNEVKVTLQLQRLEGNKWVNVTTMGPRVNYNTNNVHATNTYTVARGYHYRVSGSHIVIKNGVSEAISSYSNGVLVS